MAIIKTQSVLLLHYNNYFNRIVKKLDTIAQYKAADTESSTAHYAECENINFVPGDGITTSLVLGYGANPAAIFNNGANYDYLIVEDVEDDDEQHTITRTVNSRWFILEQHRTREKQYELILRRDVIADNLSEVEDAPIYLEKGYINNVENPLLYNKEALQLNQIKQYEIPLKDETKTGWVVGYIPNNWQGATVEPKAIVPANADFTCAGIANWDYWQYCTINPNYKPCWGDNWYREILIKFKGYHTQSNKNYWGKEIIRWREYDTGWNGTAAPWLQSVIVQQASAPDGWASWATMRIDGNGNSFITSEDLKTMVSRLPGNTSFEEYVNQSACDLFNCNRGNKDYIMSMNGKTVYDSVSGLLYRIRTVFPTPYAWAGGSQMWLNGTTTAQTNLYNFIRNNLITSGLSSCTVTGLPAIDEIGIYANQNFVGIILEQNAIDVECVIDTQRAHLQDAPYDMFCIPYSDTLKIYDGTDTFTCNQAVALSMASAIGEQGGSGAVFDVQLLPYCPIREAVQRSGDPSDTLDITTISYDIITQKTTGAKLSAVLWAPRSTFTFNISELEDINYCKFKAPYTSLGSTSLPVKKYLKLDTLPDSVAARRAISTTSNNNIKCYKVDKSTGKIIENLGGMNTIQLQPSTNVLQVHTYSGYQNPVIDMAFSSYNSASWFLMFYIDQENYGSQNMADFAALCKYTTLYYYDVDLSSPTEAKLTNECNLYRLSSGNQSSMFEFSPAKSFGFNGYKVDCTYKPFQPWIHIIPNLGGLYGDQFTAIDDARGLVLGGDYSLTQLTNTWATYKLQNSTYQDMFNREIQHMDVENSIQEQQGWFQAVTGTITGGVTGGVSGGMAGGVYGAIAGAAVGTAAGYAGAVMDIQNMYKMQYENKDFKTDMYNYNLRSMQAIPSGLAKTSAFVYNTRLWPFLEVYTCTEVERQAMRDKLTYDGMTIMAIGRLRDYLDPEEQHFWRGDLIRLPNLKEDSHMAEAIYSELKKGIYL